VTKKNKEQPEIITTYVSRVRRVYVVPTNQGITLDLFVELACGGTTVLSGYTSFCDTRPVQVLKSNIDGTIQDED
jgi:hypothetical protein